VERVGISWSVVKWIVVELVNRAGAVVGVGRVGRVRIAVG